MSTPKCFSCKLNSAEIPPLAGLNKTALNLSTLIFVGLYLASSSTIARKIESSAFMFTKSKSFADYASKRESLDKSSKSILPDSKFFRE